MVTILAVLCGLLAFLGTGIVRRYAVATSLLDHPNARSSHVVVTPRGGGLAIVGALAITVSACVFSGCAPLRAAAAMFPGLLVAAVGFADDRNGVGAGVRLLTHGISAALLLLAVPLPAIPLPSGPLHLGWVGVVGAWVAITWSINLFNFMDGTDAIAASQAVFVFGSVALFHGGFWRPFEEAVLPTMCATASLGFLVWNWPPARIFMGDVGSGFLGYMIAAAALVTSGPTGVSLWTWAVLHGAFLADSTATLTIRATRRQRLHEAHRSHVYQRMSRRWSSHKRVLLVFGAINIFWLFPLALLTVLIPHLAAWITLGALLPLFAAAIAMGAGVD